MKSSDDVQILSIASRANRGRCVVLIRLKPAKVDTNPAYGLLAVNRYSGYQSNSRKESVPGNQWAHVSDFRNCKQITK
jgi:hypothetical protein